MLSYSISGVSDPRRRGCERRGNFRWTVECGGPLFGRETSEKDTVVAISVYSAHVAVAAIWPETGDDNLQGDIARLRIADCGEVPAAQRLRRTEAHLAARARSDATTA